MGGRRNIESVVTEFDTSTGAVLREWDFGAILGDHMRSQGNDSSAFIWLCVGAPVAGIGPRIASFVT